MKKIYIIIMFGLYTLIGNAQPYIFSQFNSTYTNLTSPTVISSPNWDDFTVYTLPLPFAFNYFGTNFNTIYVMGGFAGFVYDGAGTFASHEIYSYDNSMTDFKGTSTISYQVTGSSPNRILKIQTLNANFYEDDTENDYANVQLWLYEGSNIIEMHYGPSSILGSNTWEVPGCPGPTVGIIKDFSSFVCLSGSAANPTASSSAVSLCVTGAPPLQKVYKFAPNAIGIGEINNNINLSLSPNPSKGVFTISSNFNSNSKVDISIKNNLGQTVYNENTLLAGSGHTINMDLMPGIYFIQIVSENAMIANEKIIIQ
ncbi:MAG: T9SS type A sorting domain-containing protein [Bacteroidota bacterium]